MSLKVSEQEMLRQYQFIEKMRDKNAELTSRECRTRYFYIGTFGCQMNKNDSEKLSGMLSNMGYSETENILESDLVIFNTCCVRENAELKVYGHLGALKEVKMNKPNLKIVLCGCMMQQSEIVLKIKKSFRQVDIVFGTHNLHQFPELLYASFGHRKTLVAVQESEMGIAEGVPVLRKGSIKAWVTIMYGCNNFCSYCIVPYVRGRERSRELKDIVQEVFDLSTQGYREVTLLGQNVNSYGLDLGYEQMDFATLLEAVSRVPGILRIRFMTSHPKDFSDSLISVIRDNEKVVPHLHFPLQSGSSKVLSEMNRKYTKEQYLELVERIKRGIPDVAISTDIIVGFPGESEQDFEETLAVLRCAEFDMVYSFLYSKRTGTPAAKREDHVPQDVQKERFARLVTLQNAISKKINDSLLGQVVTVLVEGFSEKNEEKLTGRTDTNKIVNFIGSQDLIGECVKVRIEKVQTWSLGGVRVD